MRVKAENFLDTFSIEALLDEKDEVKKLLKEHKDDDIGKKLRGWRTKVNQELKEKGYDKSRHT